MLNGYQCERSKSTKTFKASAKSRLSRCGTCRPRLAQRCRIIQFNNWTIKRAAVREFSRAQLSVHRSLNGNKSNRIGNKQVALNNLATDSMDGSKIKNLSIRTSDLGDSIVTSGKIKDGTIQRHDIAPGILPSGASTIFFGSCDVRVFGPQPVVLRGGSCVDDRVLAGDRVIGSLNFGEEHSTELWLVEVTTEAPDDQQDGFIHWTYYFETQPTDTPVDFNIKLDYVVFR